MVSGDFEQQTSDLQTHLKMNAKPGQILFLPSLGFGGFGNLHCCKKISLTELGKNIEILCFKKLDGIEVFSLIQNQVRKKYFCCDNPEKKEISKK